MVEYVYPGEVSVYLICLDELSTNTFWAIPGFYKGAETIEQQIKPGIQAIPDFPLRAIL